jgi:hypothetical protein
MKNLEETKAFLDRVDSIQKKFLESLVTGQRDPIFGENKALHQPEIETGENPALIDSQGGTF